MTQQIQMRCLIVTQDASVIIGKAGKHVNEIREKSGARVNVSESIPGNPERILHVSGPLDAVSKAFGLIVRRINDEPFDMASVPGSRAVTIKFIIPNSRMGSLCVFFSLLSFSPLPSPPFCRSLSKTQKLTP